MNPGDRRRGSSGRCKSSPRRATRAGLPRSRLSPLSINTESLTKYANFNRKVQGLARREEIDLSQWCLWVRGLPLTEVEIPARRHNSTSGSLEAWTSANSWQDSGSLLWLLGSSLLPTRLFDLRGQPAGLCHD